jgi:hypothetical protein
MARHVRQLTVADSSVRISTELSGMVTEMLSLEKEVHHVELSGGRNSPRSDLLDPISGLACAVAEQPFEKAPVRICPVYPRNAFERCFDGG